MLRDCVLFFVAAGGICASCQGTEIGDSSGGATQASLSAPLGMDEVLAYAAAAGVPCDRLDLVGAIAYAESRLSPDAVSSTDDWGLWQINWYWHSAQVAQLCGGDQPSALLDPTCNAKMMAYVSGDGGYLTPWSTYTAWTDGGLPSFDTGLQLARQALAACAAGCCAPSSPTVPSVSPCEGLADDDYCGESPYIKGGDAGTLYHCRGGLVVGTTPCPAGCEVFVGEGSPSDRCD